MASASASAGVKRGARIGRLRLVARTWAAPFSHASWMPESLTELEALGQRFGQLRGANCGLCRCDVVWSAQPARAPGLGVQQQPRGARIAIARLAGAARVDQPLA